MPQPRKKTAVIAPEVPVEPVAEAVAEPEPPKPRGYLPRPRWIRATADWQDDRDDSEKLTAEINVAGLNLANVSWIWNQELTLSELWDFLAERVRGWNAMAYDRESRAMKIAPGPDEIGWKAFSLIDSLVSVDLTLLVAKALRGGDARTEDFLARSAPAPERSDASSSAST